MEKQTHKFFVKGMHCPSCVIFIEEELGNADNVSHVSASLTERTVTVSGDFEGDASAIADILTKRVVKGGYSLSLSREKEKNMRDFMYALPIATGITVGFFLLQKAGIVNLLGGGAVTYSTAMLVGFVASLSTCLAVVGGVVLSLSAMYAKAGMTKKPQIIFHIGRLLGFFVLGGILGFIGGSFPLGPLSGLILTLLASLAMLLVGLNLAEIFKFSIRMPAFLSKLILKGEKTHEFGPFILGVLTFILPCGFTQAMQIYALSSGSFITGGLTMLFFALGTLPILALISFGALVGIESKSFKGVFFKTAGLVLLALAVFNIWSALAGQGLVPPINF